MGYDTNISKPRKRKVSKGWPLLGVAALVLATSLFCTLFWEETSGVFTNLDRLASIALKAMLAYLCAEAAGFLRSHRKRLPHWPTKRGSGKPAAAAPTAAKCPDEKREAPWESAVPEPLIQPAPELLSAQGGELEPYIAPFASDELGAEGPQYSEGEKYADPVKQLWFSFHNENQALDIIDRTRQGPILLKRANKGVLMGNEIGDGQYAVQPGEECLTENELRYSPLTVCFEVIGYSHTGQKARVRCEKLAILAERADGLYEIAEKGQLTVISII